ncbi:hypothetical protein HKBW3C_02229, partial [Candidatus Hakubella thermalkaliphila]
MPPADLLTLSDFPASIGYGHLVDADALLANLGRYFWLEVKAVRADLNPLQTLSREEFIPCLHIRDGSIVEDIGQQGEETISHHMPEEHVAPL